jgi:ADP-ribose pyrophosphatase
MTQQLLNSALLTRVGSFLRVTSYTFRDTGHKGKVGVRDHVDVYRRDASGGLVHFVDSTLSSAERHRVLLVRQIRYSTTIQAENGEPDLERDPMFVELPAGVVEPGELPMETFRREVLEETGVRVDAARVRHVASYYPSPGACSEKVHLYHCVLPASAMPDVSVARGADEFERVVAHTVTVEAFLKQVADGELADSKALVAAEWLRRQSLDEIGQMT